MSVQSERGNFYVYMVTNPNRTALYTGVTNNLITRLSEHWDNRGKTGTFAGRYYCYNLVYYETFDDIRYAILREKELKKWNRNKKEALISTKNRNWEFLNHKLCGTWPPIIKPTR